jgi:cytochrome c oxidase cbb3-type subunit I/II
MLWMPSWGGMINGLLTLRGAWSKVAEDPILKFFVVGITFYGMSTFEGPMLSIKSINALSHYTDWTIAHVHAGALGWVGFMVFGMIYWMAPRLYQAPLWSRKLMAAHFWIATIGILLYVIPIYFAGITQGLMWRAFDDKGLLAYPNFLETVIRLMPFYWVRVLGGALYLAGLLFGVVNLFMTWKARPKTYAQVEHRAPRLAAGFVDPPLPPSRLEGASVIDFAHKVDRFNQMSWHRRWERLPLRFTVWTIVAVAVASLFEIIPTFVIKSNISTIATVKPYTPLELAGRDIYVAEGCYNCHSQMVRPIHAETERYGDYSQGGEFVYDHPFQWGSRRIGPDLHRIGGKYSDGWHINHLVEPKAASPGSIMPNYPHLVRDALDFDAIPGKLRAMVTLGVPYEASEIENAVADAKAQARKMVDLIVDQDGPDAVGADWETSKAIALTAYLQRLGTDIYAVPETDEAAAEPQVASAAPVEEGADGPH